MIFSARRKAFLGLGLNEVSVYLPGSRRQEAAYKTFSMDAGGDLLSPGLLGGLLETVADWIDQTLGSPKSVEMNWVISDPWVHQRVFQVDRIPGSEKATDALVRWRFNQELGNEAENFRVAWQVRSSAGSSGTLYTTGLDAPLYKGLCHPWIKRRWPVTSMVTLLHGLEATQDWIKLDHAPLTLVLTNDYWLTWRPGTQADPGVRCRWFADDPDCEALLRDIARAVNEEGREKMTVYGSDTAPDLCRQIIPRFSESMAADAVVVSELYRGCDSASSGLVSGLRTWAGGRA